VLNWYKLSAGKKHECILDYYLTGIFSLKIEELKVDLKSGVMNINADCNEVAENIALAFSASLLHVLCIPRKRNWKEGYKLGPVVQNNICYDKFHRITWRWLWQLVCTVLRFTTFTSKLTMTNTRVCCVPWVVVMV